MEEITAQLFKANCYLSAIATTLLVIAVTLLFFYFFWLIRKE
jgi:hypothetical protein